MTLLAYAQRSTNRPANSLPLSQKIRRGAPRRCDPSQNPYSIPCSGRGAAPGWGAAWPRSRGVAAAGREIAALPDNTSDAPACSSPGGPPASTTHESACTHSGLGSWPGRECVAAEPVGTVAGPGTALRPALHEGFSLRQQICSRIGVLDRIAHRVSPTPFTNGSGRVPLFARPCSDTRAEARRNRFFASAHIAESRGQRHIAHGFRALQ